MDLSTGTRPVKGLPPAKRDIHLRIDADVLDWFKQAGREQGWLAYYRRLAERGRGNP